MTSQISKLGNHRNGKRIWIEGTRLIDSGFTRGTLYSAFYGTRFADPVVADDTPKVLVLTSSARLMDHGKNSAIIQDSPRKVSGKGNHPIIDISGKKLGEYFSGCESVQVIYNNCLITIVGIPTPAN